MPYTKKVEQKEYQRLWYLKNKNRIRIITKNKRYINKDIINKRKREIYHSNDIKRKEILKKCKIYTNNHKEEKGEYDKKYYLKNKAKILKRCYRYNREKYGISLEQYSKMINDQGNRCAICANPLENPGIGKGPCIDHSHCTGLIRGILCRGCNSGLGNFKDNINNLKKAVIYLSKYKI
jgi:hypothetical protein